MSYEPELDLIGVLEGTDKSSLGHGYLSVYEKVFRPYRHREFNLLEIGVFGGASLRSWKTYFERANIVGIDIHAPCKQLEEDRINIEIGSQDDPEFLDNVARKYEPFIIIDDGSHIDHHIIFTFERLFPMLPSGGYYVIEDAYIHFRDRENTRAKHYSTSLKDYFLGMAADKVRRWADVDAEHGMVKYLTQHMETITFLNGAIFMQKKSQLPPARQVVEAALAIASRTKQPRHWFALSGLMAAQGESLSQAEAMVRKAIEGDASNWEFHHRLADVLARQGRIVEAVEAEQRAAQLGSHSWLTWHQLARLQLRNEDHRGAINSLREAIRIHPTDPYNHLLLSGALDRLGDLAGAIEAAERGLKLAANERDTAEFSENLARLASKRIGDGAV